MAAAEGGAAAAKGGADVAPTDGSREAEDDRRFTVVEATGMNGGLFDEPYVMHVIEPVWLPVD